MATPVWRPARMATIRIIISAHVLGVMSRVRNALIAVSQINTLFAMLICISMGIRRLDRVVMKRVLLAQGLHITNALLVHN